MVSSDEALLSAGISCLKQMRAGIDIVKSAKNCIPGLRNKRVEEMTYEEFISLVSLMVSVVIEPQTDQEPKIVAL